MRPGDAISIKSGDNTSLAFYRTHCAQEVGTTYVHTWCGITLPRISVTEAKGEQECHECIKRLLEVEG